MLSYFVHLQSITDNQTVAKAPSVSQGLDSGKQHKDICTNHGQSGLLSFPFQSGQADIDCISSKSKTYSQGPFAVYQGPCPVHPMSSHTLGDCFNNLKNKTSEGQHNNNNLNKESHNRHRNYSFLRG